MYAYRLAGAGLPPGTAACGAFALAVLICAIAYRAPPSDVHNCVVIHLSSQPRKLRIAKCGRVIDGTEHTQTMLPGQVDCPDCRALFHAGRVLGGYSQRKSKIP